MIRDVVNYNGDDIKSIIKATWSEVDPYITGIEVYGSNIYTFVEGDVIDVGKDPFTGNYVVDLYVNKIQLIRYCNLKSVDVEFGDSLLEGDPVGEADDYVRIEYCSTAKKNSRWKVIVNNRLYYKHNPIDIETGKISLDVYYDYDYDDEYVDGSNMDHFRDDADGFITDSDGDEIPMSMYYQKQTTEELKTLIKYDPTKD